MIGRTLGHYRIESKLGEGGMGVVYQAQDMHLGRLVAVKVLAAEAVANPERKRRFAQEAKAASALNHPNIVTIYDIDQSGGLDFIAMEYVAGTTLARLIGAQGMPPAEAVPYALQLAEALSKAHAAGIVHRDLKPQNVMVTGDGLLKVLDFGLAKLSEPAEAGESAPTVTMGPRTEEGAILGTVAYMSPEQAEGKKVDARSDIFSFGVLLYEMLTGRRPFQGDSNIAILSAILRQEPEPVSTITGGTPPELESVLLRCLRKEPDRRFQQAADIRAALEEVREALRPGRRRWKFSRSGWIRRGAWAIAAVVAAIAIAAILHSRRIPAEKDLAVLPFQCEASDEATRAFCDGLNETTARKLGQLEPFHPRLRVAPASHLRRYEVRTADDARLVLGSTLALAGSVHRGPANSVAVTLVDTATLRELRRETINTTDLDVLELHDGLIRRIANMLGVQISREQDAVLALGGTRSPEAYDLYLQGHGRLLRPDQPDQLNLAMNLFRQAAGRDPGFALAHAGLAEAGLRWNALDKDPKHLEVAQESARRSLELEPRLVAGFLVLGDAYVAAGQSKEAIEQFQRALQLEPTCWPCALSILWAYDSTGRLTDAEAAGRGLIETRPTYPLSHSSLGSFYNKHARYAEAESVLRKALALAPNFPGAYLNLGAVYHFLGRHEDAIAMMRKALALQPTATGYTNLGTLYWFLGRYADSVPLMEKAVEMDGNSHLYWGNLADAYRNTPERAAEAAHAYRRAIELAEQSLATNPRDAVVRARLALFWANLPDREKALAEITQARRLAPTDMYVLMKSVYVYELTGQRDRALSALDLALQGGHSLEEVQRSPELAKLREDPRYSEIAARHRPARP